MRDGCSRAAHPRSVGSRFDDARSLVESHFEREGLTSGRLDRVCEVRGPRAAVLQTAVVDLGRHRVFVERSRLYPLSFRRAHHDEVTLSGLFVSREPFARVVSSSVRDVHHSRNSTSNQLRGRRRQVGGAAGSSSPVISTRNRATNGSGTTLTFSMRSTR